MSQLLFLTLYADISHYGQWGKYSFGVGGRKVAFETRLLCSSSFDKELQGFWGLTKPQTRWGRRNLFKEEAFLHSSSVI